MTRPVDLRRLAESRRWRTYLPEWAKGECLADQAWLLELPCRRGTIAIWGADSLSVSVTSPSARAEIRQLAERGIVRVHQDGDREMNAVFDPADIDHIAEIVRPKRTGGRKLTGAEKSRLADLGAAYRFVKATE